MIINEIIDKLKISNTFPTEAVIESRKHKEEVTEILLDTLKNISIDSFDFENDELFIFSLYLLAEFKEKKAFPLIINLLTSFDEDELYYIFGDITTENMDSILASTFNGDMNSLLKIIENPLYDEFLRSSILDTIAILYKNNVVNELFFVQYLNKLLELYKDTNDFIIQEIISIVADLKIQPLIPEIRKLLITQNFEEYDITLEDFEEFLSRPPFQSYDYITDCETSMSWIYRNVPIVNKKIGRNDPCPCGSGKKYKKCCGKN